MRRILTMLVLVMSLALVGCQRGPAVHTVDAKTLSLSGLQGKWLVLVYWASWCEACKDNMPQFNAFYQSLDKNTTMLGFDNILLPHETLTQAITKVGVAFPVIRENLSAYYHLPRIEVEPTLFVINPKGRLVKTLHGVISMSQLKKIMVQLQRQLASSPKLQLPVTPSVAKSRNTVKSHIIGKRQSKKVLAQLV